MYDDIQSHWDETDCRSIPLGEYRSIIDGLVCSGDPSDVIRCENDQTRSWICGRLDGWAENKEGIFLKNNPVKTRHVDDLDWIAMSVLYSLRGHMDGDQVVISTDRDISDILVSTGFEFMSFGDEYRFDLRSSRRIHRMISCLPGQRHKSHIHEHRKCPDCGKMCDDWQQYLRHAASADCEKIRPVGERASLIRAIWFSGCSPRRGVIRKRISHKNTREIANEILGPWSYVEDDVTLVVRSNPLNKELDGISRKHAARRSDDWDVARFLEFICRTDDHKIRIPRRSTKVFVINGVTPCKTYSKIGETEAEVPSTPTWYFGCYSGMWSFA
jgi:hypothetical protein